MENSQSLIRKARALESAGEDEGALGCYLQALAGAGASPDANLLARAGVLQLRLGRVEEAAGTLARASDLYAGSGMRNNALALCHRLLRADVQRPDFLRRLGELSAVQGYRDDARRGLIEYASLVEGSDPGGAAEALRVHLEHFPDDLVVKARLKDLTGEDSTPGSPMGGVIAASAPAPEDFGLLTTLHDEQGAERDADEALPALSAEPTGAAREGGPEVAPLEGLEPTHAGGSWAGSGPDDGLELMGNAPEPAPPTPEPEQQEEDLPLLAPEPPRPPPATDPVAALRERLAADPEDLDAHEQLAEHLARESDAGLDAALAAWVEQAFRSGDRVRLIAAYLAVARRFAEGGQADAARKTYDRVLKLDPGNLEARQASDYVDLGSMVMEDEASTRFQVEAGFPSGDEERDFEEILTAFRERVSSGIDAADSASHYDLGIAFKEMGLWDDAITQLQRALRAGSSPLATLEMLGECYFQKGEHELAVRMLERAEKLPGASPADLEGVRQWLGRARAARGPA